MVSPLMRSERYFCHDEKQLTAAVTRVESGQPRQIMILAGAEGSGRRHFLHTVASRLTGATGPSGSHASSDPPCIMLEIEAVATA